MPTFYLARKDIETFEMDSGYMEIISVRFRKLPRLRPQKAGFAFVVRG